MKKIGWFDMNDRGLELVAQRMADELKLLFKEDKPNMKCYRCGSEMYDIACHSKCPNCSYSLDCSDL